MRLLNRVNLARLAGVSPAAITKSCKRGSLAPACRGKRVDVEHPAARAYLRARGIDVAETSIAEVARRAPDDGRHALEEALLDASAAIASKLKTAAEGGAHIDELERMVRELISERLQGKR